MLSILAEALEDSNGAREANKQLLQQYASTYTTMLNKFHEYKARHVSDMAAWHRSYRTQLAEARSENCRLREQIWEVQTHATNANDLLRDFRRKLEDNDDEKERKVELIALRQEVRFWKRMAMPEKSDDDAYWSDDDDLIDSVEKERVERIQAEQAALAIMQREESEAGMGSLGGVEMQRDDSVAIMPLPPSRPSSAASSTGSSGQNS